MGVPVPPLREPAPLSPVVIAGGGPAGAAAACRLARAGKAVTVLERETAPTHKICGEFLSGEALADLSDLDIDTAALGASPITSMRLVHRGRVAHARLPFAAAGLSRMALDEALLRQAGALGAELYRGVPVRDYEDGVLHTKAGAIAAPLLMLATGKHDVRGLRRKIAREPEALIGFKLHLRLNVAQHAELAGHVELILLNGGYAGLQLIERGIANLCLLIDRYRYEEAGQDWSVLLTSLERESPHLATRLSGAVPCWDRPLSIFRVPYGFIHHSIDQEGVYRLGDQAAVIPSFCGDGLAIALHSARLAATAVLAGHNSLSYHRAMRRDAVAPVRLAYGLYRLTRSSTIRRIVVEVASTWPGILGTIARHTRITMP